MPDVPVTPAPDPTPVPSAVEQAITAKDPVAYKAARHAETFQTPPADPSPAVPAVQVASTDALPKPASEPAKPKGADARVQELLADRAAERLRAERAERELETLRSQPKETPKAASSPAAAITGDPRPDPLDTAKYPDGQFDLKFQEDLGRWAGRQEYDAREQARQAKSDEEQAVRAITDRNTKFRERIAAATAADPEFTSKISPDLLALQPIDAAKRDGFPITALNALASEFLHSEHGPQLLRHFSDHPDDIARFQSMHPEQFLRALGRLEASFDTPAAPPPSPPTITTSPAPPPTLSTGSSNTTDPVDAALKAGDFPRYQQAKRRRELAALGLTR